MVWTRADEEGESVDAEVGAGRQKAWRKSRDRERFMDAVKEDIKPLGLRMQNAEG